MLLQLLMIHHQLGLIIKIVDISHVPLLGTSYSHSKIPLGKQLWRMMLKETGKLLPITQDLLHISMVASLKRIGTLTNVTETPSVCWSSRMTTGMPLIGPLLLSTSSSKALKSIANSTLTWITFGMVFTPASSEFHDIL